MKQKIEHDLSLASRGLKYKLKISFCLMSILPLLVSAYLVSNYIFPQAGFRMDVGVSLLISVFIALIGFLVVKEVFDRIMAVTSDAKLIAAGDISRRIEVKQPDEVGDLGDALNQLTQRIRSNMDELKSYGEKTTEINLEIQRRVIVLSSLLQISALVSQSAKIEEILKLTVEKSRLLADSELAYLFFRREGQGPFNLQAADGALAESLSQTSLAVDDEFFSRSILKNKPLILDKENALPARLASGFSARFGLKNTLALPVYLRGKVVAILGIGNNRRDFSYKKDDIELMDIFAKQIAIAVENDMLMQRVEKLEIKDTLTGLYNESFIRSRLDEEIKRSIAYQRPCAFVVFDLDNFQQFRQKYGAPSAEATLKKAATIIKDSVSQIDRVARIGDDEFGVLIPEKNKRQALALAETIRKKLEFGFSEELDAQKRITASAGVSENPLDGVTQEELVSEAKKLVGLAKSKGKNRVASLKEPR